jgi:uncharacterized membrane protein
MAWMSEVASSFSKWHQVSAIASADLVIGISTAALLLFLAKWRQWQQMGILSIVSILLLIYAAGFGYANADGLYLPSAAFGFIVWPCALLWHWFALKHQGNYFAKDSRVIAWLHILGFWLLLFIISAELKARFTMITDANSSWTLLAWILAPASALFAVGQKFFTHRWPLSDHRSVYLEEACTPIALYLLIWCWVSNVLCPGNAQPLPYLPFLNPLELAQALILLSLVAWWQKLPESAQIKPQAMHAMGVLAFTSLALLTGCVLRSVHQYGDIAWNFDALFTSRLAQAAVSIVWAICGVGLMLFGNRRASKTIWIAGVVLLGVVVLKLFLIELAGRGGLYRIVSFIGVGIAFLIVGYFAPVPTQTKVKRDEDIQEAV